MKNGEQTMKTTGLNINEAAKAAKALYTNPDNCVILWQFMSFCDMIVFLECFSIMIKR